MSVFFSTQSGGFSSYLVSFLFTSRHILFFLGCEKVNHPDAFNEKPLPASFSHPVPSTATRHPNLLPYFSSLHLSLPRSGLRALLPPALILPTASRWSPVSPVYSPRWHQLHIRRSFRTTHLTTGRAHPRTMNSSQPMNWVEIHVCRRPWGASTWNCFGTDCWCLQERKM